METLFPIWHSVTLSEMQHVNDLYRSPSNLENRNYCVHVPDYGGVGIDLTIDDDGHVHCKTLKHETDTSHFNAKEGTLPFMPVPNKVTLSEEPCLQKLKEHNNRVYTYSRKLMGFLNSMKRSRQTRNRYMNLYDDISKLCQNGEDASVSIPGSLLELANLYSRNPTVRKANWRYTGNCLRFAEWKCRRKSCGVLMYPGGEKLSELVITPIFKGVRDNQEFRPKPNQCLKLPLPTDECIYGVSCLRLEGTYLYGIRQRAGVTIGSLRSNIQPNEPFYTTLASYENKAGIAALSLSPFIFGEYMVITEKGKPMLRNVELPKSIWNLKKGLTSGSSKYHPDDWWTCQFGSQPRALWIGDHNSLSLWDVRDRLKEPSLRLLSTSNPFLGNGEIISVMESNPIHSFQHFVGTTHHLLLCDERFPKQPVFSWNHLLELSPTCCSASDLCSSSSSRKEVVVLLSSHVTNQTACVNAGESEVNKIQPRSLSPPWHLCRPNNCVDVLCSVGMARDGQLADRLCMPVTGVCPVPHEDGKGFTAFQVSSVGDVYFQDYRNDSSGGDKNHEIGPGYEFCYEDLPPALEAWVRAWKEEEEEDGGIDPHEKIKRKDCSEQFLAVVSQEEAEDCSCTECGIRSRELLNKGCASSNCVVKLGSFRNQDVKVVQSKLVEESDPTKLSDRHKELLKSLDDLDESLLNTLSQKLLLDWVHVDEGKTLGSSDLNDFLAQDPLAEEEEILSILNPRSSSSSAMPSPLHKGSSSQARSSSQTWSQDSFNKLLNLESSMSEKYGSQRMANEEEDDDFMDCIPPSQDDRPMMGELVRKIVAPVTQSPKFTAGF